MVLVLLPNRPLLMELPSSEEPSIGSDFDSLVMYEVRLKIQYLQLSRL